MFRFLCDGQHQYVQNFIQYVFLPGNVCKHQYIFFKYQPPLQYSVGIDYFTSEVLWELYTCTI